MRWSTLCWSPSLNLLLLHHSSSLSAFVPCSLSTQTFIEFPSCPRYDRRRTACTCPVSPSVIPSSLVTVYHAPCSQSWSSRYSPHHELLWHHPLLDSFFSASSFVRASGSFICVWLAVPGLVSGGGGRGLVGVDWSCSLAGVVEVLVGRGPRRGLLSA
jgi:hypothetical protein